jgi:hypothetical protein
MAGKLHVTVFREENSQPPQQITGLSSSPTECSSTGNLSASSSPPTMKASERKGGRRETEGR